MGHREGGGVLGRLTSPRGFSPYAKCQQLHPPPPMLSAACRVRVWEKRRPPGRGIGPAYVTSQRGPPGTNLTGLSRFDTLMWV